MADAGHVTPAAAPADLVTWLAALPTDEWLIGFNNDVFTSDIAFVMVTVDGGEDGPAV